MKSQNLSNVNISRNNGIDLLKLILSVLVVMIHADYPWRQYVVAVTRCAVPCFFMISGFFIYQKGLKRNSLIKSIRRILTVFLWSALFYFLFAQYLSFSNTHKLIIPGISQIKDFFLFNDNPFGIHLWYVSAYIYVLIIVLVLKPNPTSLLSKLFVGVALLSNVFLCSYYKLWGANAMNYIREISC